MTPSKKRGFLVFFLEGKSLSLDPYHIGILIVLLAGLWFAASFFLGCNAVPVPFGCDAFWGILRFGEGGKPKVLIVYGDEGLGNPDLLAAMLSDRHFLGAPVNSIHIEKANIGNLRDYDLVIVERARQISTGKLKMFMEYANFGGRLVWTGDAGTIPEEGDELLYEFERSGGSDENSASSPWARKDGNKIVAFDDFLGVNYFGVFCELKKCTGVPLIGILEAPSREHDLVKAIRPGLKMYGDFSITELRAGNNSKTVLSVDFASDFVADEEPYYPGSFNKAPQCSDKKDNDGDTFIDYYGLDLDGDNQPDIQPDPGCLSPNDGTESGSANTPTGPKAECDDGRDNDSDGKTDYPFDECCVNSNWNDEFNCPKNGTECSDRIDNDGDGLVDFTGVDIDGDKVIGDGDMKPDPSCSSAADSSEGKRNLGRFFPVIVTNGFGEKIAYYSIPPEFFVSDEMPLDPQTGEKLSYGSILQNMYFGMTR